MGLKRKKPHPSSSSSSPELPVSSQRSEDEVPSHGSVEGEEGESEEDMYEDIIRACQLLERDSGWLNTPSALVDEEKPKTQSPQVDADDASDHSSAEEDERKESEPSMNPYEQWSRYLIELNSPGVASVKRESSPCEPISIYSDKTPKPLDQWWCTLPWPPAPPVVPMKSDSFVYQSVFTSPPPPSCFVSPPPSVCSVKSDSSMYHPPCFSPLKLPSVVSPSPSVNSVKSDSSMFEPPSFHPLKKEKSASSPSPSVCSMKSDSSMFEPPSFNLATKQSALSPSPSVSSMKSDSSMFEPPSFHPQKTKRLKTDADRLLDLILKAQSREAALRSCSLCEKDLRHPVKLPCGHQSCKHCAISSQRGSPRGYSCKKCGKKFKRDPEHQTDTEDDADNLNTPSTPSGASDDTLTESSDQDLQSVLLQKKITRVEMETEKLRVEKEKLELEKTKLALEIRLLQQRADGKI